MGFWGNVGTRVRGMLRWDKESVVLGLAKGGTSSTFPQTGFDLLQSYGYDLLSDYLKLEHDLMSRFVDYEEMDDYPELASAIDIYADDACITADTEIPMLNGKTVTIGELYDNNVKNEWIYAFDNYKKQVVAGQFSHVALISENLPVWKVSFIDKKGRTGYIKATANHKFLMLNGEYRRVSDLSVGDRLMALFKFSFKNKDRKQSYENVLIEPFKGYWKSTHRMVLGSTGVVIPAGHIVHHKDRNGLNNHPDNIVAISKEEHDSEHVKFGKDNPRYKIDFTASMLSDLLSQTGFISKKEAAKRLGCGYRVIERLARELGADKWSDLKARLFNLDRRSRGHEPTEDSIAKAEEIVSLLKKEIEADVNVSFFAACEKIEINRWVCESAIKRAGYTNWSYLKVSAGGILAPGNYSKIIEQTLDGNDVVTAIEYAGEERIFDLVNSVPTHNFAAGHDGRWVFIKNTQTEALQNKVIWCDSSDKTVQEILTDLIDKRLRLDEEIWSMARTLIKYGNDYEELLVTQDGLVGINFLPPATMRRIEGRRGELFGFVQDFKGRFGYCGKIGSRVWTANGMSEIQDFKEGSAVLAYGGLVGGRYGSGFESQGSSVGKSLSQRSVDGSSALLKVKKRHASGVKRVFKIATMHREIFFTEDHPVLVQAPNGDKSWTKVKDIKIVRYKGTKQNIDYSRSDRLVICTRMAPGEVPEWSSVWNFDPFVHDINSASRKKITLSERPTVDFCRLFGFLLGDGWIEGGSSSGVSFARGIYPELNEYYDLLLSSFDLKVKISGDGSKSKVNSVELARFLESLGWINGAENKRIPLWMFGLPEEFREALLQGFMDADGWDEKQTGKKERHSFEVSNYDLARDFKNLIDGLGYICGNVGSRQREPGTVIINKKTGKQATIKSQLPSYTVSFTDEKFESKFIAETVLEVSYDEDAEVFDLEVEDDAHNFISDGVVVHNSPDEFKQLLATRVGGGGDMGMADKLTALEDWEVLHMRLRSKHRRSIYGYSVLEPARWIWKRLMLLEDAAMVYRLQRAPERYAFYVDVGDLPPKEAFAYLNKIRQQYKKTKFYNPTTGKLDLKFNPLSQDEDFFVPIRKGVQSSRIDVLNSPSWQHMDDIEYFRLKLYAAIKVPKTYLGFAESTAKGVLSQEDVRFARTVLRLQRELRNGIKKMCRVHLAALNINPAAVDYEIYMTVPSSIFELAQLEVRNAKADFAGRMSQFVSLHWILQKIFGLSEEEIEFIIKERHDEQMADAEIQAKAMGLQAQVQGDVQMQQQQAQQATGQALAAQPGSTQAQEARQVIRDLGRMSHLWPLKRQQLGYKPITERELFHGNREHEKRMEDNMEQIMKHDHHMANKLNELRALIDEIRMARPRQH